MNKALRSVLVSVLVIVLLTSISLHAASEPQEPLAEFQQSAILSSVGQIGGGSYSIATQGNYGYTGIGPTFTVVEIDELNKMAIVGQAKRFYGMLRTVAVSGEYAYVIEREQGSTSHSYYYRMHIVDVSNPASPTVVNTASDLG